MAMAPFKNKLKHHLKSIKHRKLKTPNNQYLKQLKHSIKVTKSYELQKTIRKLKEANDEESSQKKENLENKIRCLKLLDVNTIAQEYLNSIIYSDDKADNVKVVNNASESGENDEDKKDKELKLQLINSIKRHSRCIKTVNDIKQSMISSTNREFLSKNRRVNKQKPNQTTSNNLLFVESLSGAPNNEENQQENRDDDEFDNESFDPTIPLNNLTKMNRPGQRARKAKKLALQNKEEGTTWDNSMNWREKKKRKKDDAAVKQKNKRSKVKSEGKVIAKASDVAEGKDWKTKEDAQHPSWLAASRPEKSATIVPFAGKKITFD